MAANNYSGIQIWVQVRGRWVEVQLWKYKSLSCYWLADYLNDTKQSIWIMFI